MSVQLARELEEFAQEDQRIREQAERDSEIARIQVEELKMMIDELDRNNEMIAKHMSEYEQAEGDLSLEEKTELITELIKYQRDLAQIKKYQAQQSKLASKTERRKFYTSVLRSNAGWKAKDFKGMTFEQIEEKFIPVWEKMQDFIPMNSKLESERLKRPGIQLDKEGVKKLKTVEVSGTEEKDNRIRDVYQIFRVGQAPKAYPYFDSMLKEFDKEDVVTLWKLVKDRFKTEFPKSDLEKCLFWPLKVMVHCLSMEWMIIYMLDDVEYPLPKNTLQRMLDPKCEVIRQETTIEKNANNKRKFKNQPKDNRVPQQPPFKKPDVARAYTIRANGKKAYAGNLP
ncbi:hypothetical protein Tco_0011999 [Tanacetum coccineum]